MVSALEDCQGQSSKELALCRDGNRLREFAREGPLGGELDVSFVGQDSRGSAGTGADWTTDQSAFAAAGESADEHTCSGAATNHQPVALLVALAGAVKGGGMEGIVCAIHLNAVEGEPQVRVSLDQSTVARLHYDATDAGALGNHCVSIDDERAATRLGAEQGW